MTVLWVVLVVAGLAVVGYGARVALRGPAERASGGGYALFGLGVGGYALGRLLGEDWTLLTWLCIAGPLLAYWGSLPGRPGATGPGRAAGSGDGAPPAV
ncbi:hypothetical protein [Kineosporia sp. R_H_3]|uniref:hypothetical protein n=1 Tax=Kineosporia sp. R_H_3 TaxID=1961848 RepID=UPI000B4B2508|nr:hypothetical protein [Kineosporia sp. R_H_3]